MIFPKRSYNVGHAAIAETAFADVGGVLQVATAEMSGISSASSVGVGELVASMRPLSVNRLKLVQK